MQTSTCNHIEPDPAPQRLPDIRELYPGMCFEHPQESASSLTVLHADFDSPEDVPPTTSSDDISSTFDHPQPSSSPLHSPQWREPLVDPENLNDSVELQESILGMEIVPQRPYVARCQPRRSDRRRVYLTLNGKTGISLDAAASTGGAQLDDEAKRDLLRGFGPKVFYRIEVECSFVLLVRDLLTCALPVVAWISPLLCNKKRHAEGRSCDARRSCGTHCVRHTDIH